MNSYEQQTTKIYNLCAKCKYEGCIYEQNRDSSSCPTWCKNYLKDSNNHCRCAKYLSNDKPTCEYFEEGEILSNDELIDKENVDYKRYIRIAKRRDFDNA